MLNDFLANLAVNLAHDLLRASADRLRTLAFGDTAQRSLRQCYESGFQAMLDTVFAGLNRDHQALVETILRQFVAAPGVAQTLLDVALDGANMPDLPALRAAFDALDFDRATLPVDFDRALIAFHRGLSEALVAEATRSDSPLFNRVNLGRMLTIQTLLQQQGHTLAAIVQRLQRIEGQGGAVYNVIIAQATGVAIGDGARVEQALPADVRAILDDVLRLLRDLSCDRRPPAYTAEDVRRYLENVVELCQTLDLRGAGGPVDRLPLERVYVALKADASNAAERRANWQQFLADLAAYEQELTSLMLDDRERWRLYRRICVGLDPMGLTLALRNRARAEQGDYLALAARRIDLGELIGQERWMVLLGDPGAGKTTLIRWLALRFAQAMLDGAAQVTAPADQVRADLEEDETTPVVLGPPRLPVPVRLADYAAARWIENRDTGLSLFDYLGGHRWQGCLLHPDPAVGRAIVQDAIRNGRTLIMLDGLDEIAESHRRREVVDAIVDFVRTWVRAPDSNLCAADPRYRAGLEPFQEQPQQRGGNQVLITSRPIGYYLAPLPATLPHYTVEEMSEPAIARFCRTWTAAVHAQTGRTVRGDPAADAEALRTAVLDPQRPALREIAANPLLLTILASLFYDLNGSLPERRTELYDQVVEAFIRQRQDAWASLGLSEERFRYAMGYVAVRLHANPDYPTSLAEEAVVQSWLEDALREFDGTYRPAHREQAGALFCSAAELGGFLLARGDGAYGFIHRTFQEYFAALFLAWDPHRVIEEVYHRLDEPAWHEPLRLAVADLARRRPADLRNLAKAILEVPEPAPGLLPRNALFLAACLPELQRLPPDDLIAAAVTQLLATYADRDWPPDESTLPPLPLRNAIERALRPLGALPAARAAFADALTGADPARWLAAADLILEFDWCHPDLIPPLLAAARDHAEPVATIREALWRQVRNHPQALKCHDLPLRTLLDDPAQAAALTRRPVWRAVLQALYLRPDWTPDEPLTPDAVCFDSRLTPWLQRAWQEGWSEEQICAELLDLAQSATDPVLARDAAWALAISDEARWRRWLTAASKGEITAQTRMTLAGVMWRALARALNCGFNIAIAELRFFALARVSAIAHHLVGADDLALVGIDDLFTAIVRDIAFAHSIARISADDLAYARAFSLAHALSISRADALYLARILLPLERVFPDIIYKAYAGDSAPSLTNISDNTLATNVAPLAHAGDSAPSFTFAPTLARFLDCAPAFVSSLALRITRALSDTIFGFSTSGFDKIAALLVAARKRWVATPAAEVMVAVLDQAFQSLTTLRQTVEERAWRALTDEALADEAPALAAIPAPQPGQRIPWRRKDLQAAADLPPERLARLQPPARDDDPDLHDGLRDLARDWLGADDPLRRGYAALLLAELGELTADALPDLLPLLAAADDLPRHRARVALLQERRASACGFDLLLALAAVATNHAVPPAADLPADGPMLIATYCGWALNHVIHDRADWLQEWTAQLDAAPAPPLRKLLSHIHRLDPACWPVFLALLTKAGPRSRAALLESLSWLLRENQIPAEHSQALADVLLELAHAPEMAMAQAALFALSCFHQLPPAVVDALLAAAQDQPAALPALARLAPHLAAGDQERVDRVLAAAAAWPEADAALVRRLVNRQPKPSSSEERDQFEPAALLAALAQRQPDSARQLRALLAAGTDDDVWDDFYHGRIALAIRELLAQHEEVWSLLLDDLRAALDDGDWQRHRIALAGLARSAEAMPARFNRSAADLEPLLLRATRNLDSFNARRFAITALSYLRVITPEVLAALLRLVGDTQEVQDDALAAAGRFNRLHPSLGQALPHELVAALTDPSALRARAAVRLLEALGTSPAASSAPGLRRQIVAALAAALQAPNSRRYVWVSAKTSNGTLDQDLWQALLRVAGF
jgi:hypothetical protein